MAPAASRPSIVLAAICAAVSVSCPVAHEIAAQRPSLAPTAHQQEAVQPVHAAQVPVAPASAVMTSAEQGPVGTPEDLASAPMPAEGLPLSSDQTEPDEEPAVASAGQDRERFELAATAREAWILAKPTWKARKIGYLRGGTVIERDEKPAGFSGCEKGWYRIRPRGYVCVGKTASLDVNNPVVEAVSTHPDRDRGLPYAYAMSRFPPPPLYVRLPTLDQQREVEPDLDKHLKQKGDLDGFAELAGPVPGALLYERTLPSLDGHAYGPDVLHVGRPVARSGFGLLEVFEWTDRLFGLTTDLTLVPLDRTRFIRTSTLRGVKIEPGQGLPVAFVRSRSARQYRVDEATGAVQDAGAAGYRQGFALTGRKVRAGGRTFVETRDGVFLDEASDLLVIPPVRNLPGWATPGRKWIDVSILRQALVAYEGGQPVFATLVSTGADGLGDPKETHSTVRGVFVIHTKHVTATMDGDEVGDQFDLRDVPYVQYFTEGYAIHGAYWHDEFGVPRSHGCVNVSPQDAAWLFAWTEPQVPEGWHARLQLRGGTIVYTHP